MSVIFQAGGALPADHPTYVERQVDGDALRAALNGDYLHIIAPRQVGKTSLLKRLTARLNEMGWRCAYVDLATLMDFPKPIWYAELGKALAESLTPGQTPTIANQVDLRRYLLHQALPWPDSQPRLALFLDEVEGAGKARDADGASFSDTFFSMFRALYNERDKLPGTLVVSLAGAVNPGDLVKDPAISPFNVGQEIDLDDFTAAETRTLTEHLANLGLSVDETVHQAIYEWTNGHPYLTQCICAELETSTRSGDLTAITLDNVRHIVEQVILNPANPFQRDKNLRHVAKMLNGLSTQAAQLWSRLQAGESVYIKEATDDLYLELYLTGAVKPQVGRLVIRNHIYALAFGDREKTELGPLYEKYAEHILIAFYQVHQDPRSAGVRAHGFPGVLLAVEAGIFSMDDFRDRKYRTSQKRWEIVAALRELIDKGYIKRTEDEPEDHRHPDEWNFRLTPRGKDYAYRLLTKGCEERGAATREAGLVKPTRIFISSTWEDLQPEREAVEKALHRMRDTAFAGMEYFGSRPETPKEVSLAEVDRSHIYIGIFAHRYGSGITEAEYRRARGRSIPCLIYFKDDSVPVPPAYIERDPEKITKLEDLKRELKASHTVSPFSSPDHLATQVVTDLHNLLGSAPTVREKEPPQCGPKYQITITDSQGVVIGDQAQVVQQFGTPAPSQWSEPDLLRLQHLAGNIRQDLALLEDYEDALRYEDDPRRRVKYRREIEQLRESAARYQWEYDELRAQVTGEPSVAMQDIAAQLQHMDTKLDVLLNGQTTLRDDLTGLRQAILACFDAGEQKVIATVVEQLDQSQLATVQAMLDGVEAGHVPESQLQETLTAVQETLAEIKQRGAAFPDPALIDGATHLSEVVDAPKLDVKHKLKVTLPIVPSILSYEGEVELKSGLNLEATWQRLMAKVRGDR
ncbi:MAG: AAA-like domain-containing protein [Anaerolineae bacterium]